MKLNLWTSRVGGALLTLTAALTLGACDDLLRVDNPGAIVEEDLSNPEMIPMLVNGVVGEFQPGFSGHAFYTATFSDELVDAHSFQQNTDIDLRRTSDVTSLLNISIYTPLHRARAAGDLAAERLRGFLGTEAAGRSLDVARVLTYSGYSIVLLAEAFCASPIDVSEAHEPPVLFQMAIDRFDEAIAIATAAKSAGAPAVAADSLLNLARVGAARAALNRNDLDRARTYAEAVPADFNFMVNHSANTSREYNPFWAGTVQVNNVHLALDPSFQGLNDPRIPFLPDTTLQSSRRGDVPLQPLAFSGWNASGSEPINVATGIRMASGLEARYIVAEAGGMSDGELLNFVNERRAVGNQPSVNLSGEALRAELREQRRRDFFMDGHRLGDLRRYIATGVGDFFPKGKWVFGDQEYGDQTCFDIPISEKADNPNL